MAYSGPSELVEKIRSDIQSRVGSARFFKAFLSKYWYPIVTRRLMEDDHYFLNWGYEEDPALGVPLDPADEPNRYYIQLYHRTVDQGDIRGKDVLEVSCGHGGGANYLVRTFQPATYTALDYNAEGIAYCQKKHKLPGLTFVHGNAEALPFPDGSFDAVVNVEASHNYPTFTKFLDEVARVLRPGGQLLFADMRFREDCAEWESELANGPLRVTSERIINEDVMRGLEMNAERGMALIRRHLPKFMHNFARDFAAVPGSRSYNNLENGKMSYRMYSLVKD
jgi:ubiquinone/menaquinone biosynthesis C-methylase UbiE